MIKILQIRENKPGGIDNYCHILEKMFDGNGEISISPVKDYPTIDSRFFHYYYKKEPLTQAIAETDIVHINGYTAMGTVQAFKTALQLNKRIVYTAHWHPFSFLGHPLLGKLFFNTFLRSLIKKAHVVTTINNEDTTFFSKINKNVVQIPHCYCGPTIMESQHKKKDMILFVGRLNDHVKGCEHLMYIPKDKYDVHLVGQGNIPERCDFTQHVGITEEELSKLYSEASLLLVPSKYEAFSYVALEALLHGTPVLMSERVRIADYLTGISGYEVFHYGNYNEFLKGIELTIGQKVDTKQVNMLFSKKQAYMAYSEVYKMAMR
jgi:glycosyltransferase involved in cell wall biosynthesis